LAKGGPAAALRRVLRSVEGSDVLGKPDPHDEPRKRLGELFPVRWEQAETALTGPSMGTSISEGDGDDLSEVDDPWLALEAWQVAGSYQVVGREDASTDVLPTLPLL
jgi:hypothetical protein